MKQTEQEDTKDDTDGNNNASLYRQNWKAQATLTEAQKVSKELDEAWAGLEEKEAKEKKLRKLRLMPRRKQEEAEARARMRIQQMKSRQSPRTTTTKKIYRSVESGCLTVLSRNMLN